MEDITKECYLILITLVVIYIQRIVEKALRQRERIKMTSTEREIYFQKLQHDALELENKKQDDSIEQVEKIHDLQLKGNKLRNQLAELFDEFGVDPKEEAASLSSEEELKKELKSLNALAKEVKMLDENIRKAESNHDLSKKISRVNGQGCQEEISMLMERIAKVESENETLRDELTKNPTNGVSLTKKSDLDPEILGYLKQHNQDITLDFLSRAYETALEFKASHPDKELRAYIDELKVKRKDMSELAQEEIKKKAAEIELNLIDKKYQEELERFNEVRVEYILKNSGACAYLKAIKSRNEMKEDIISNLENELESTRSEIDLWKNKFTQAEEQCETYFKAYEDTQERLASSVLYSSPPSVSRSPLPRGFY